MHAGRDSYDDFSVAFCSLAESVFFGFIFTAATLLSILYHILFLLVFPIIR
jgi:hypothetical protein